MPAPQNLDQLLGLIRKSGLVEPQRFETYLQQISLGFEPEAEVDLKEFSQLLIRAGVLTNFQSEQLLQGKWRGFSIGKYRVLERLGSGGMGNVYLCEHLTMCHKVAVKVLPTAKKDDPAALGRFYREARASGVLDHPNLVRAFDIDQDGELHYLVMEYVDGINLQQLVLRNRRPLGVARACHYIYQAACGLDHAHKAALVHRDIKPANILVDRAGTVRILDMGLARFLNDEQDLLTLKYDDKNVLGTADYLSPEQAADSHNVDIRSDIYSLGATFFFLLTGQPLFPEGKVAQKLIWHRERPHTPVRELRPEVPVEVSALVDQMLAKEPRGRFQSPAEVLAALDPWVQMAVAPPTEEEIPRVSLAARVTSAPDIDIEAKLSPVRGLRHDSNRQVMPITERRRPAAASVALAAAPMADENTPRLLASDRPTAREKPSAEVSPLPCPVETLEPTPAPVGRLSRVVVVPFWRRHARIVMAVALVVGVLGGLGVRLALNRLFASPSPAPQGPRTLVVDRSGQAETYPRLAAAILDARPGDRIVLRQGSWEESLRLDATTPPDLTIEGDSGDGRPVIWRAARPAPETAPLLRLDGVRGLRLRGFVLDGQERLKTLLVVEGHCPGLTLEDLHLRDAREVALHLKSASGTGEAPLSMRRLRTTSKHALEAGIFLDSRSGTATHHLRIRESRFEGPASAAIAVLGPTDEVEVAQNRFFNVLDGVQMRKVPSPAPPTLRLAVVANTFCDVQRAALHFEQTPALEDSEVRIERNLFAATAALALVEDFSPRPPRTEAHWIWGESSSASSTRSFRRSLEVSSPVESARLHVAADDGCSIWINGQPVGHIDAGPGARRAHAFDVSRYLIAGRNVIAVQVANQAGPAGLLVQLDWRTMGREGPHVLTTDAGWRTAEAPAPGWQKLDFDDDNWGRGVELTGTGRAPEWDHLVWEGRVREHFRGRAGLLFPRPSGNVRDSASQERFPSLDAEVVDFRLPTDPGDDSRFLRSPALPGR